MSIILTPKRSSFRRRGGHHFAAKQQVITLARDIGYAPIDTGPLYTARYLESMAHLNIQIAVGQGGGTNAAFVYLKQKSA